MVALGDITQMLRLSDKYIKAANIKLLLKATANTLQMKGEIGSLGKQREVIKKTLSPDLITVKRHRKK